MEEASKKRVVIYIIVGTILGIVGRGLTLTYLDIPLYLNFVGVFVAAYFAGPIAGTAVSLLTVVFGIVYGYVTNYGYVYSEAASILPMILSVMFIGNIARKYNAFTKVYNTFGTYALVATLRSFVSFIINSILYKGRTGIELYDTIIDYQEAINGPLILKYLLPSMISTFMDTFITLFVFFFAIKLCNFLKKTDKSDLEKSGNVVKVIIAGLIMAHVLLCPIQSMAVSGDNFVKKEYGSNTGLLGGAANSIVQANDGSIWVGTYGGVYKYNGENFVMQRDMPKARSVESLYVDADDNLWISSNGTGLVVRTSDNEMFTLSDDEGLPSDTLRAVTKVRSGIYYVGTVDKLAIVKFDGNSLEMDGTIPEIIYAKRLTVTPSGLVLAVTSSGQVYLIKDDKVIDVFSEEEKINNAFVVSDSEVYFSGENANLYRVSVKSNKICVLEKKHIDELECIKSVLISSENIMYLAGNNRIGYINEKGNFTLIHTGDFNSSIEQIMEDYQGNIWFTSARCGLLELSSSAYSNLFDVCNVENAGVNTVLSWQGLLYIGTDEGLVVLDEAKSISVENFYTDYFDGIRIRSLGVDECNHLWVSTQTHGVYEIEDENRIYNYSTKDGLPDNRARCTLFLSDARTIVSTYSGISFIKNHQITDSLVTNEEMSAAYALCLLEVDEHTIFAGTNGDGICVIKDGKPVKYITHKNGIPSGVILNIYKDRFSDGYFVLSGSGLCYMDVDYTVTEFTEFPYYNNTDLFQTSNREVVVLSTAGIYIAKYDELMEFEAVNTILLDEKMGLPGSITSNARNYMTDEDVLYFGGSTGVYKLDCSSYSIKVNSYKINISSLLIDGKEQQASREAKIEIPTGAKKVTFRLNLYNYTTTDPYVRYYMEDMDEMPVTVRASELQEISYFGIPSGEHLFTVDILDSNKSEIIETYSYSVNKRTEAYESIFFKFFYILGLILVGITIVVWIAIIVIDVNARREKIRYNEAISIMEKEKADALEKSLAREEMANRSKSEFLANMSHEIRTPINAIIGMDTMILRESNQKDIKKYAQNIYGASNTLLSLINDILDFSKIESGKMELILADYNLGMLINDVNVMMRPKAEAKQLMFNIDVNPHIPVNLYGDEGRIKQIIINILNNAVKYTEKGYVTLKVDYKPIDTGSIGLSFSISDTGIGIKEEDLDKLFSAFDRIEENRNKNIEGTGLGMSITKNLLAMMGSELEVESVYGKGSNFSFTIIQTQKDNAQIGNYQDYASVLVDNKETEEFRAPAANILVVDDVEMNLIVMTSLLKRTKIQIDTADSGLKAIELAKARHYDIIFLDAMMPKMDGVETLGHIRSKCVNNLNTPVIMLTANAVKGAREEYLEKGFNDYLSKPINENELERMILNYLPKEKILLPDDEGFDGEISQISGEDQNENAFLKFIENIPEIDVNKGIEATGGEDTYESIVKNFYETADMRIQLLKELFEKMDVDNYTIQVHALKSSARLIGAILLSQKAFELEIAGKEGNLEKIKESTPEVIELYKSVYSALSGYFAPSDNNKEDKRKEISSRKFIRRIEEMRELIEAFDNDSAKAAFLDLKEKYIIADEYGDIFRKIQTQFAEADRSGLLESLDEILSMN